MYRYVGNGPVSWIDPNGLATLHSGYPTPGNDPNWYMYHKILDPRLLRLFDPGSNMKTHEERCQAVENALRKLLKEYVMSLWKCSGIKPDNRDRAEQYFKIHSWLSNIKEDAEAIDELMQFKIPYCIIANKALDQLVDILKDKKLPVPKNCPPNGKSCRLPYSSYLENQIPVTVGSDSPGFGKVTMGPNVEGVGVIAGAGAAMLWIKQLDWPDVWRFIQGSFEGAL